MKVLADKIYFVKKNQKFVGVNHNNNVAIPVFVSLADAMIFMKIQAIQTNSPHLSIYEFDYHGENQCDQAVFNQTYVLYLGMFSKKKNSSSIELITFDKSNPWPSFSVLPICNLTKGVNLKSYFENEIDSKRLNYKKQQLNDSNATKMAHLQSLCDCFLQELIKSTVYRKNVTSKMKLLRVIFGKFEYGSATNYLEHIKQMIH